MENNNVNETLDTETTDTQEETAKTYTQEEVMELLEKGKNEALAKQKKELEKKFQKQTTLSKLDGDERARAEKDERIKELEEQLAEFTIEKNKSELKSTLASRGLDAQFADLLHITDDTESNQKVISDFDKLFRKAVQAEVQKRINGNTPKQDTSKSSGEMTKEIFNKMTLLEQQKYLAMNPEFKDTLMGY